MSATSRLDIRLHIPDGAAHHDGHDRVGNRASQLASRTQFISEQRYDTVYSTTYDEDDPPTSPVHLRFVADVIAHVPVGGTVLDAPGGTGKYFGSVLEAGRTVVGCGQSAGMLACAAEEFPQV